MGAPATGTPAHQAGDDAGAPFFTGASTPSEFRNARDAVLLTLLRAGGSGRTMFRIP